MPVQPLDLAAPFFKVDFVTEETTLTIAQRSIFLNLGAAPVRFEAQQLASLQSAILANVEVHNVEKAVVISGFEAHRSDTVLFEAVKQRWPSAFEVRGEERLRGVAHYISPKVWVGRIGLTMYHSGSVPLKVGLHRDHPFCPVPGFREVHTQVVGVGKMQQCRERDIDTLYLEETMAPGTTHRPMYDAEGNYPWHQFETITPSIFMAVEMLPEGAAPPEEA